MGTTSEDESRKAYEEQEHSNGLVMVDLNGGDYMFVLVDETRWKQLLNVLDTVEDEETCRSYLHWLSTDDEASKPEACPNREGKVRRRCFVQDFSQEDFRAELIGILALR